MCADGYAIYLFFFFLRNGKNKVSSGSTAKWPMYLEQKEDIFWRGEIPVETSLKNSQTLACLWGSNFCKASLYNIDSTYISLSKHPFL